MMMQASLESATIAGRFEDKAEGRKVIYGS